MSTLKEVRLLVVDEQEGHYEQLKEFAELCSHEFHISFKFAKSERAALELVRKWEPSVMIVDAHLRNGHGFQFLDQCKEGPVPVIITSDSRSTEIEESAFQHGASGYLPKTDNPDELESHLHTIAMIADQARIMH